MTEIFEGEVALYEFVKEILPNEEVEQNLRILNLKEIDVYIPSKRVGFELIEMTQSKYIHE